MKTILKNVIIVTMNEKRDIFPSGFLAWENDKILKVADLKELDAWMSGDTGWKILDGRGGILMPGMINPHCHMGMIPFRGLGDDCRDRLRVFLFPMEQKAMNEEMVYQSTRYAACEMLLAGVTTVLDMYYYEKQAAAAMDEMGIRGFAGETVMDQDACDVTDWKDALRYGEELIRQYEHHPRIRGCVTPHGTNTCSPELLKAAYELDHRFGVPFTLHAAEMDYELAYFQKQGFRSPIQYLKEQGVLDHTLLAHGILLDEEDICLIGEAGASLVHCIGSNAKAAKGVAPVTALRSTKSVPVQGRDQRENLCVPVGLGTDGPASGNTLDLFTQMKLCADIQKNTLKDRSAFPAKELVAMATIEGARALGIDALTGSLEAGKLADFVLLETASPNMYPVYDPYSTIVYSAQPGNVEAVFVAGACLVKEKKLTRISFEEVRKGLSEALLHSPFGEYQPMT